MPRRDSDWDDDEGDRPRKRSRRRDDDDDEEEERPRKRRRRRKPPPKSGLPVALILLLGGGLVLGITGVVILLTLQNKGGAPGPNANGVINNPLGLPAAAPPPVVRPPLPPGWVEFKHPDCRMSIYCPQQPFRQAFNSNQPLGTPVAAGMANLKEYGSTPGSGLWCYVSVSECSPSEPATVRENDLKQTLFLKNPTAREVLWAGKRAWEVNGETSPPPGTRQVSRRLWAGNRFYRCELSGQDGHPTAAEQAAFFDSFVLGE